MLEYKLYLDPSAASSDLQLEIKLNDEGVARIDQHPSPVPIAGESLAWTTDLFENKLDLNLSDANSYLLSESSVNDGGVTRIDEFPSLIPAAGRRWMPRMRT